jgi:hypothetical protein
MHTSSRLVATALGIVLSLFAPRLAVADTHVSGGTYYTDQHWTLAGSPYIIDGWVWFETSLLIDPGVTVILGPAFANSIMIDGTLSAIGTDSSRITITSQADAIGGSGSPGDWRGIFVGQGASAVMSYVDVRYGGWGCCADYSGANINVAGWSLGQPPASLVMDSCTVRESQTSGIVAGWGSTVQISHTELSDNVTGIAGFNAHIEIKAHSHIVRNSHDGVFLNQSGDNTFAPTSIMDSNITDNLRTGLNLVLYADTPLPYGHFNNIYNNNGGLDQSQIASLYVLKDSNWSDNYWGPPPAYSTGPWDCDFAPSTTTQKHVSYVPVLTECVPPPPGPVSYDVAVAQDDECSGRVKYCAADRVIAFPFVNVPYNNEGP